MDGNANLARPNVKILSDDNLSVRGFLVCDKLTKGKDYKKIDFAKLLDDALSQVVNLAKVYSIGILL